MGGKAEIGSSTTRVLKLRYRATCGTCAAELEPGTKAEWDSAKKAATCLDCRGSEQTPFVSVAGASARAEAERRRTKQAARLQAERERRPVLGRLRQDLFPEPDAGSEWAKGAAGEEALAASLNPMVEAGTIEALHDRRIPRSRANIDHLVVAPSGIWIVDAKRYTGRIRQDVRGGWLNSRRVVTVGGRDRTSLVDGMEKQRRAVVAALTGPDLGDLPIRAALCFVDGDWGLRLRPFEIGDVLITWPKALRDRLGQDGDLDSEARRRVAAALAGALPPAG